MKWAYLQAKVAAVQFAVTIFCTPPGNRFWPALFAGGITERLLWPEQERELLQFGYGITNLVDKATIASQDLSRDELLAGGRVFAQKITKYRPGLVAILGVPANRLAFDSPTALVGSRV